jgi:hypothetical protein
MCHLQLVSPAHTQLGHTFIGVRQPVHTLRPVHLFARGTSYAVIQVDVINTERVQEALDNLVGKLSLNR